MYNHYIPQSDGSYRRSAMPDRQRQQSRQNQQNQQSQQRPSQPPEPPKPVPRQSAPQPQGGDILSFFKGLFPREIDTADLMILFLLLLMNRDDEDSFSPILTMALYFLL